MIRNNSGSLTTLGPVENLKDPETGEAVTAPHNKVSILPGDTAEVSLALMAVHAGNPAFEARFKSKELEILKPGEETEITIPSDLGKPPEADPANTPAP